MWFRLCVEVWVFRSSMNWERKGLGKIPVDVGVDLPPLNSRLGHVRAVDDGRSELLLEEGIILGILFLSSVQCNKTHGLVLFGHTSIIPREAGQEFVIMVET